MNLNIYLKNKFTQLSFNNVSNENDFLTYDNFKKFIIEHYNLVHMEKNNYIKYVKVRRQILKLYNEEEYLHLLQNINNICKILYNNHTFPLIDIKKYMFKIFKIYKLIDDKKKSLVSTIKTIRIIFDVNCNNLCKIKILQGINSLTQKYIIFLKYSKQLIYYINKLIEFEYNFGIDHKMIELNNIERNFLGKKSEYIANNVIVEYVKLMNELNINNRIYYYETNIDFIKLFSIINNLKFFKGEVDGIIIYKENDVYIIDKIIEVKSSIKATFEDIFKFEYLQKYFKEINNNDVIIKYNNFIFTNESFVNIIDKDLTNWVTYICINNINQDYIEKSHLYFSTCLKIVDDNFIKDFYIDKIDKIIQEKFEIIKKNRNIIEDLFQNWINKIKLGHDTCNVFVTKR